MTIKHFTHPVVIKHFPETMGVTEHFSSSRVVTERFTDKVVTKQPKLWP